MNIGQNYDDIARSRRALIAKERVEGLASGEQEWLGGHLRECAQCSADATRHSKRCDRCDRARDGAARHGGAHTVSRAAARTSRLSPRASRAGGWST